jgi:hypothetical protein
VDKAMTFPDARPTNINLRRGAEREKKGEAKRG